VQVPGLQDESVVKMQQGAVSEARRLLQRRLHEPVVQVLQVVVQQQE
jgi:hypothetical protein